MKVFEIEIEFDRKKLHRSIDDCIHDGRKGYVCFADANVLSIARKDEAYLKILQGSMVNSCDGGSVATLVNRIHGTDVRAYNGPDLFENYIGRFEYRQLLLGNKQEKHLMIVEELKHRGLPYDHVSHLPVPFANVEDFDFKAIAEQVNETDADIIWVSLGAPKQEKFMAKLLPYIDRGVMFGIGAAFNFYIGEIVQPKIHIGAFRFIWLDRIYREPKKQLKRVWKILKAMPLLYLDERKRFKASLR
jgi:N-acetylglucosaminyldiphosphoundecaprenol N-acetyl-beta-D-mannosaminyltransferase